MTENPPTRSESDPAESDGVPGEDERRGRGVDSDGLEGRGVDSDGREGRDVDESDDDRGVRRSSAGGFETLVRDGESVAGACPYCDRPFATDAALALHVGDAHEDVCSTTEREAYETAFAAEDEELFYFHLKVVAALAALYAVVVLVYMMALSGGYL